MTQMVPVTDQQRLVNYLYLQICGISSYFFVGSWERV